MTAALQLARVHGVDGIGSRGRPRGKLQNVTLMLPAGVYGFLGRPEDGTAALCELCAGVRPPRVGVLTVAGNEPARDPALRQRIGACLPAPQLPPFGTVGELGALISRPVTWDAFGLGGLVDRPLSRLGRSEARAVELALALSISEPQLVVLYEPWQDVGPIDPAEVRRRIGELGAAGTPVVVAAAEPADLRELTTHVYVLHRGELLGDDAAVGWPALGVEHLVLWLAEPEAQRRLAKALQGPEPILGVAWDADDRTLTVRGRDLSQVARAVAAAVTETGVEVLSLRPAPTTHALLVEQALVVKQRRMAQAASGPIYPVDAIPQQPDGPAFLPEPQPVEAQPAPPPAEGVEAPENDRV